MPTPDPDILQAIRDEQRRRGWTEYRLAKRAGMQQTHIRKYLAGDADIMTGKLGKVLRAVGLELSKETPDD